MGERGNIVIVQHGYGVDDETKFLYLYSHWRGHELLGVVRSALRRGQDRWDDEPYLARIIFSELIRDDIDGDTGYGISAYLTDYSHPSVVVDCEQKKVWIANPPEPGIKLEEWTFKDFIDADS